MADSDPRGHTHGTAIIKSAVIVMERLDARLTGDYS
jgi:hypothetical protein